MNEERSDAACTVYEGKIVVIGGKYLKSVEAYDCYENKWTYLPDINEERCQHASVSMSNKLFLIDDTESTCEMFNSFPKTFSWIKTCSKFTDDICYVHAVCIGQQFLNCGKFTPGGKFPCFRR